MPDKIIKDCYKKAIELLLSNSSKFGVLACSPQKKAEQRNYLSVFARDASICALGMIASQNKKLIKIAKTSLIELAKHQAYNGEIPNYIKPEISYVDFWRLGSIDASLWWLLALNYYYKQTDDKSLNKSLKPNIVRAINWLSCQEHNGDGLLRQTEASDWADLMPRSGKVLYTNVLWCKVKNEYKLFNTEKTIKNFNLLFFPFDKDLSKMPKCNKTTTATIVASEKNNQCFLSFVNYLYWGQDLDIYANSLAILSDLTSSKHEKNILKHILSTERLAGFPVPVSANPIKENSPLWRKYMESHRQNYPYAYQNGGTWPFAACFFAMALAKITQKDEAISELEKIAHLNEANNWRWSEWFHTKTGHAHGMHGQSWNAGAFLLAYHYIYDDLEF